MGQKLSHEKCLNSYFALYNVDWDQLYKFVLDDPAGPGFSKITLTL